MDVKRRRSENFSVGDKELLIESIKTRKEIIENKRTDSLSVRAKNLAWKQVTHEFNAQTSPRSTAALKTCWENLKRKFRKTPAYKTGDGQQTVFETDPVLCKIKDVLSFSLEELQNPYDSDVLYNERFSNGNMSLEIDDEITSDSDNLQGDAFLETTDSSSQWCPLGLKKSSASVGKEVEERTAVHKSSTTIPHVHTLALHGTSEQISEVVHNDSSAQQIMVFKRESSPCPNTNSSKGSAKWPHRQSERVKNYSSSLAETKLELARLAKEHAIAEEKRKVELHELQVKETKLKIEILKMELKRKKAE